MEITMDFRKICFIVLFAYCVFTSAPLVYSQGSDITISGVVKDQTGAVLTGASVTVTQSETGTTRTTQSEQNGRFIVPQVSPGVYRLQVDHSGFQRVVMDGIKLAVGDYRTVDLVMPVG